MPFFGFLMAAFLFCHFNRRLRHYRRRIGDGDTCGDGWNRQWGEQWQRHARRAARRAAREATRWGRQAAEPAKSLSPEEEALRRARRRAGAQAGFYAHLMSYLGVIAFLALINLFTTRYPWFIWPAFGWGIGLFSHWMAVFGSHLVRERYFDPAVERELRRERATMQTEKQASIDELSSSIAHEIRNPIAAAKSLVQQMGEDPTSVENVEYAKVALEELERVAPRVAPPQVRQGGGLQLRARQSGQRRRFGADAAPRQARFGEGGRLAQLHRGTDRQGRRGEAPAG